MNEQTKAVYRRLHDSNFITRYFVGDGIDIGVGNDSLSKWQKLFTNINSVKSWDIKDGNATFMNGIEESAFDFVHSSNCLEHIEDPRAAIRRWIEITKIGGYIIITVPDEDLYEQGKFPSTFNEDHKWTFTINKNKSWSCQSINIVDLLDPLYGIKIIKIELIDYTYLYNIDRIDQTTHSVAESSIEIILQRIK